MTRRDLDARGDAGKTRPGSSDDGVEQLRGFGPIGLLGIAIILAGNLLFVPLSAILVLVWARLSRTPWAALGVARPRSWIRVVAIGLPFGVALELVMKGVAMRLLGAPAVNQRYHYLSGNPAELPSILYAVVVGAGFGEEVVFRGFFFARLRRLLGTGRAARAAIVLLTSALFALAHYHDQGLAGVEQAAITGLVFGTIYAVTNQLWIPIVAHAAFDVTAVAWIYWGWESAVAHLFFS